MIIYKITNLINNKIYIGLTTTELKVRWNSHRHCVKSDPRHLYCSMRRNRKLYYRTNRFC